MRYKVTHRTSYLYPQPVSLCQNVVRLRPREMPRQTCGNFRVEIKPEASVRSDRLDFFGNSVTYFAVQESHTRLDIVSRSDVETHPTEAMPSRVNVAWENVPSMLAANSDDASRKASEFIFDSPHIPRSSEVADYARSCFTPRRSLFDATMALTTQVFKTFLFDKTATSIGTPVSDVLQTRRGVCQDFAHLQIAALRSLGLPARYVSGYIQTTPPTGQQRLVGADASHAWVSVYFPDVGWIDFDPTNGVLVSDRHITIAWGRDYDDISPVRGIVLGGRKHSLQVSVDMAPM